MMSSAIFLSYASQDADAARRICDALRAAGLEVWFDLSELRGGDAWDASIRKQIKECALFVPIISTNTNARAEGYFRLEWKLAVDRSHLMADDQTFFVPVILADTPETTARVPDALRAWQWSRLTDDNAIAAFAQRVAKLITGSASSGINAPSAAPALAPGEHLQTVSPADDSNARGQAPVGAQVQPSSQGHANLDPDLYRDDNVKGVPTTTASRPTVSRTKVAAGLAIAALTGISRREVLGEVS
ncbi:MAG: toll/interleukin-1 receptor domain-containing protein, partial [Pseudoxanthomonas sp.]|nr:toll/interleukin-1 receptor domain-containing protein [Pseudoxanthomonas sp.]